MSHASVLVVTDVQPTEKDLHTILLPWHQYECTGYEDYVQNVDVTADIEAHYTEYGKGRSLEQFAEEWNGARRGEEGLFYRRTNPNAKWDWWQIGGRFTGLLRPDYEPEEDPDNIEICSLCHGTGKRLDMTVPNGCNGCKGTGRSVKWPTQWKPVGTQAQAKDVDLSALKTFAVVINGMWFERGELGWFGAVSEEKDDWDRQLADILTTVKPEQWLTVVDFHI